MKRMHLVSRLASLGLVMVLLILTGFSLGTAVITQHATNDARVAFQLSDLYEQARYEIGIEKSLESKYLLDPGSNIRAQHRAAAAMLVQILRKVYRDGDGNDRACVQRLLAEHRRYLLASNQLFAAVDAGAKTLVLTIDQMDVNPVYGQIQQQMNTAVNDHQLMANQRLTALNNMQHLDVTTTPDMFVLSLLLLGLLWAVLWTYRRRMNEDTQAELTRLERAALLDYLTDLGNHRAYQEHIQRALEHARLSGETIGLALIDIDELRLINNEYGHVYGDHVLIELASLLRIRQAADGAYRMEGDEFAMILPLTTLSESVTVIECLRQEAQQCLSGATISIGLTTSLPGGSDAETLREQAEAALREAKRRGRNRVVTFEAIGERASILSFAKAQAVRRLLSEHKVTLAFQPIWDVERGVILAFEALIRPAAEYGFASPQELFDIAEQMGRAHELDYVCLQAILARAAGLPPDTMLFVNLSPQTLDHDLLTESALAESVVAAGLTIDRIVLELTERSLVRLADIIWEAKQLQHLGFRLALDDTGAGNAGLEMLSQLQVDFVKVDRAVVANALSDKTARAIMAGIQTMAREANVYVIAEGIENLEMLGLVRRLGIQGVQGNLLGRPSETIPDVQALQEHSPFAQPL
jgi:diguanylate cyclase (GGDEF)-like protein